MIVVLVASKRKVNLRRIESDQKLLEGQEQLLFSCRRQARERPIWSPQKGYRGGRKAKDVQGRERLVCSNFSQLIRSQARVFRAASRPIGEEGNVNRGVLLSFQGDETATAKRLVVLMRRENQGPARAHLHRSSEDVPKLDQANPSYQVPEHLMEPRNKLP